MNSKDSDNPSNDESLPELSAVCQKIQFTPGLQVDRYILEQKIGAGGMGTVYLARHARLTSRFYAIKFIRPDIVSSDMRQRFEAEIDILEKIQHPNFVFAHDAGEFENITYLVMEFVQGVSLGQLLTESGPLPLESAAEIIRQTAAGLQHAFEQDLVHRDIKPSNLFLAKDGTVKILDLGLARFVSPEANHGLTGSYQILGTPDYMSPEQCRSSASVDIRSDIYSLGCTLYRLIAGRAPFGDEQHSSIANKIAGHLTEAPSPVETQTNQKLPTEFVAVLNRMMHKESDQRYQTPDEVQQAIAPFANAASLGTLSLDSSIDLSSQINTKSLKGALVETSVEKLPEPSSVVKSPARARLFWITGALSLAILAAVAWNFFGTDNKTTASLSPANSEAETAEPTNGESVPPTLSSSESSETTELEPSAKADEPSDGTPEAVDDTESELAAKTNSAPIPPSETKPAPALEVDPEPTPEPSNPPQEQTQEEENNPTIPRATGDQLAVNVKQIFRNNCAECHGTTRKEADLNVLDWASFVSEDGSVIPNDADGSYLFERIATDDEDYRMPELPLEALSQSEIETVRQWIEAGAPEFPADVTPPKEANTDVALKNVVGAEYILTQITEFVEKQPREDRPYFRFFSSNHLLMSGATKEELKEQSQALAKAVNHLTMQPQIVRPTVVDEGIETIFAIDIRKLGWQQKLLTEMDGDRHVRKSDIDLFDLVLLEYPYGIVFEDSRIYDQLWERYMQPANLARPVPFVRIDWFVSTATQFPLYEDLLQLPQHLSDLEEILGVESEMNMETFVAKRAGMTVSGVSQNNRVVERHPSRFGAYWKSYDFETSKGRQNMFVDPMNFHFAGGEMVFNLPNGLQGYLITDTEGNRINEAPTGIVTDKFAADKTVRNGLACMRCHDRGVKRFADNIRPAIEGLPGSSMPNKRDVLRIYPTKAEMDSLLDLDEKKFIDALTKALGEPQEKDPLAGVARTFMDNAISLPRAASELGVRKPEELKRIFGLPQFVRFGLAGLSGDNVIRRDTWGDYFDRIVAELGIGVPVAPVDGLIREDHLADGLSSSLTLKTNKRNNIFAPGDHMVISVENKTGIDQFIELVGTSVHGRKVVLTKGVIKLVAGETYRFPEQGSLTVEPKLGTESISLYANPEHYQAGRLLRGTNITDRFVHEFYVYDPDGSGPRVRNNPTRLIKKTIKIQTK